jgi:hypothetical protein
MTYGDQTLPANFAGKVRAGFLQHGLGHYLMSGNTTSEKDRLKATKQMDENWMAAQTEILSVERLSSRGNRND